MKISNQMGLRGKLTKLDKEILCISRIRVSQGAKSLKNYTFSPESHYLGKSWLKIYKNFKIFAYLGVAQIL